MMQKSYTLLIGAAATLIGVVVFALSSKPNDGFAPVVVRAEKTSTAPSEEPPAQEITQTWPDAASQSMPEATPESSNAIIQMSFDGEIVDLDVTEAPLADVLEAFQVNAGLEIEDLTPKEDRGFTETPLSFQFTGSLHDAIRFVLKQHDYNYALALEPGHAAGNIREPTLEKLYLLGPQQEPDEIALDEPSSEPQSPEEQLAIMTRKAHAQVKALAESLKQAEHESRRVGGDTAASVSKQTASKDTRLSDMLRTRAAQSNRTAAVLAPRSQPKTPAATGGAGSVAEPANPATEPSEGDGPSSEAQSPEEQLAITTRRAHAQVKTLAESLKQAEQDLKRAAQ